MKSVTVSSAVAAALVAGGAPFHKRRQASTVDTAGESRQLTKSR